MRNFTAHFEYFNDGGRGGYQVTVPALPGCVTWGETIEEARAQAQDAIKGYLDRLELAGEPIPFERDQKRRRS